MAVYPYVFNAQPHYIFQAAGQSCGGGQTIRLDEEIAAPFVQTGQLTLLQEDPVEDTPEPASQPPQPVSPQPPPPEVAPEPPAAGQSRTEDTE